MYFGVGCFWPLQHDFVLLEQQLLKRNDTQITAITGYAGGNKVGTDPSSHINGMVCYDNRKKIAQYGALGHAEAVEVELPVSSVEYFAQTYFKFFTPQGERIDKGDVGAEFRSIIGIKGGMASPLISTLTRAAHGLVTLEEGVGDDPDNFAKATVYVYDTETYPFHQAELYHQFHDGFMKDQEYPENYGQLRKVMEDSGKIKSYGCPEEVF